MLQSIEMHPAYVFDCEECGRENFVRGIVPEFSPQEMEELRDEHGIQPWETGDWMLMPIAVKCKHCGSEYTTGARGV